MKSSSANLQVIIAAISGMSSALRLRCLSFVLLLGVLASCRETEPGTAIVVEVWSDLAYPEQIDSVRIELNGREKRQITMPLNTYTLPLRLAVVPDVDKQQAFTVAVTGVSGATDVVTQSAQLQFLPGESRLLALMLSRHCIQKMCGDGGLTCSGGRCTSNVRDPRTLPVFFPKRDGAAPDLGAPEEDAAVPVDVMSCDPVQGQACGSCGGTIRCDGTCSVATPPNLGQACGQCGGTVQCDGSCTNPFTGAGSACGTCGTLQCDGMCKEATPSNFGQACGACGGKFGCDGICSVPTPSAFGQACGTCGTIQCDGTCKEARPQNFGQACGTCSTIQCDGTCRDERPANYGQACGACGGTVQCNGACTAFPAQGCCAFAPTAEALVLSRSDSIDTASAQGGPFLRAMTWTWSGELGVYRSLIQFDLTSIPPDASPSNARLHLSALPPPGEGHSDVGEDNNFEFRRNLQAWTPTTVTWANQPNQSMDSVEVRATTERYRSYSVNVTPLLVPMIQMPARNFGMSMKLMTEEPYRSVIFYSGAHTAPALRPRLEIEFTPGACGF